jgi:hypothetical protein
MDTHQAALAALVRGMVAIDPECSVYAMGSLARADYGAESDIDLFAVTWKHREIPAALTWQHGRTLGDWGEGRLDEGYVDGIKVHLNCSSPRWYENGIMSGPVVAHWWDPARILHDPSGIVAWGERCRARFFKDNPAVAQQSRRFSEDYRAWKRDRSVVREFATQAEFLRSLQRTEFVLGYERFTAGGALTTSRPG